MDSVIPCLLQSLQHGKNDPLLGVSELLVSFVAAFEHIPSQRRLGLFELLVSKVGSDEYLFVLFILLARRYPSQSKVLQFACDLSCRHSIVTQLMVSWRATIAAQSPEAYILQTISKYLGVLLDAVELKPTYSTHLLHLDNSQRVESVIEELIPLCSALLDDPRLHARAAKTFKHAGTDSKAAREYCASLLEQIVTLSIKTQHDASGWHPILYERKAFANAKAVTTSSAQILEVVLGLLSMTQFVDILHDLLGRSEVEVSTSHCLSFVRRKLIRRRYVGRSSDLSSAGLGQNCRMQATTATLALDFCLI